jgi:phage FluMu protein Com
MYPIELTKVHCRDCGQKFLLRPEGVSAWVGQCSTCKTVEAEEAKLYLYQVGWLKPKASQPEDDSL